MNRHNYRQRSFLIIFISALAEAMLMTDAETGAILLSAFFAVLLALLLSSIPDLSGLVKKSGLIWSVVMQALFFYRFCRVWLPSRKAAAIAQYLHLSPQLFIMMIGAVFAVLGHFSLRLIIAQICSRTDDTDSSCSLETGTDHFGKAGTRWLLCFFCAWIGVTACSQCSFLYPVNTSVDPNCFMTVGKGMMHGLVPYRDLLEQKGPVLYFVNGLAALVSPHSFFSVYMLELIADTITLYVMSMCADLHRKNTSLLSVPLFSLILFPVQAFAWGGKAEELFLPFLAYALYLGFKVQNGQSLRPGQMLLIGLSVGIAFWSKFTFAGFYIGWLICVLGFSLKHGEIQNLPKLLGALVLGFTLVTAPVLIYFGYHHAIRDLMKVYIYDNIFVYTDYKRTGFSRFLTNYLYGLWMFLYGNAWLLPLVTIGFLFDRTRMLLVTFAFLFCFSFIGSRSFPYYALIFTPLSCIGIASLTKLLHIGVPLKRLLLLEILCLTVAVLPCLKNANKPKEAYPQVQFAEIIRQSEEPTLLNYGFLDGGFYMAADLLPSCKAFCKLNAPIPEMLQLQEDALQKWTCEFVVTNKTLTDAPRYALAAECDGYYLYRRL